MQQNNEMEIAQENVHIFNFIKNNQRDVQRLRETFERQNCRVKVHLHPNYADFKTAANCIRTSDYTLFEYIVIVVLDQSNRYEHLLKSSDNVDIYLNEELLTFVRKNRTLANKKRLNLIQTNRNIIEYAMYRPCTSIDEDKEFLWAGPTVTLFALEQERTLQNYWLQPNADESPFVKAFCDNFDGTSKIAEIYGKINDYMRSNCNDKPVIEDNLKTSDPDIFGKALTKEEILHFFYRT